MAEFNTKFYNGADSYSDGDVENEILNLVQNGTDVDSCDDVAFPVFYHLSKIRENILNWYPFKKDSVCLEIGAGCGALTGMLCQRMKKVVSVDISERRSRINYERNKSNENLEIIVGNLHDIKFDCKFDYIIVNGVMEYAMSFTHTSSPYTDFVNELKALLSPKGKLLVAIENRLGLKYFSGAPEDHTDAYFLGLNGYVGNDTVRTFSKTELNDIFEKCGFSNIKFYYPYPDYKFASEIFSDDTVEDYHYGRPYGNRSEKAFSLFNESYVFESLSVEKVANKFANSFLVEASISGKKSNVIYAKVNGYRRDKFKIMTVISKDEKGKTVSKMPLVKEAEKHIQNIYDHSNVFITDNIKNCNVKMKNSAVVYPYIEKQNLYDVISELIENHKINEVISQLKAFFNEYFKNAFLCKDYLSDDFKEVFGSEILDGEQYCISPANIDVICDNIFVGDNKSYVIIDNEWTFNMPIPVKFIIWRCLNELYAKNPSLNTQISRDELFGMFEIDKNSTEIYYKWAVYFAEKYVGSQCETQNIYPYNHISLNEYLDNVAMPSMGLYCDVGNGYVEEEKLFCRSAIGSKGEFKVRFELPENVKKLRFDPVEGKYCECKILNSNMEILKNNADNQKEGFDIFANDDPMYELKYNGESYLEIEGILKNGEPFEINSIFENQKNVLRGQIAENQEQISALNQDINSQRENIKKKEAQINSLKEDLINRQEVINNQTTDLMIKQRYMDVLEGVKMQMHTKLLMEKEKLSAAESQISSVTQQLKETENRLAQAEDLVNKIYSSKGWRIIEKLRHIVFFYKYK